MSEVIETKELDEIAAAREMAKVYLFKSDGDKEKFSLGLKLLQEAYIGKDAEATFLVAKFMFEGFLRPVEGDRIEQAMSILHMAAHYGSLQARLLLNQICEQKYQLLVADDIEQNQPHPLTDFEGKQIVIDRKGFFTPVDALLEYKDNKNILTFKANINIFNLFMAKDQEKYLNAVIEGIKAWEGEYRVFGGQQLTVKMDITADDKLFDSVLVINVNDEIFGNMQQMQKVTNVIGTKEAKKNYENFIEKKNSFATLGGKWSVKSLKFIYLTCREDGENAYEHLKAVATHEFGHILGLGDLYESKDSNLVGVEAGQYVELDSYLVSDKLYNLVMCDSHGMISNNDIEMIVLAFSENKMQNYQPQLGRKDISKALGKGN